MIQITQDNIKRFSNVKDIIYVQDEEGSCVGVEWVNENGHTIRCLWSHFDELSGTEERAETVFRTFKKSSGESVFEWKEEMRGPVNNSQYRSLIEGEVGKLYKDNFLVDDLTKPLGTTPETYEQKVKPGLIGEAKFLYKAVFRGAFGAFPLDNLLVETICDKYGLTLS